MKAGLIGNYGRRFIHVRVDRHQKLGLNDLITGYFDLQKCYLTVILPKLLVAQLPPEDILFLELFHKVMTPSAKNKVCMEWQKIRSGQATLEEARSRIPRPDIKIASLKAKWMARKSGIVEKENTHGRPCRDPREFDVHREGELLRGEDSENIAPAL
jgi:hypothetical protein